jgi:putative acetyltransferase
VSAPDLELREETPADHEAIRTVNRLAFGGGDEAHLVDRLRDAGDVIVSIVALEQGAVVGHVLFSRLGLDCDDGAVIRTAALAPVAVPPDRQRRGIGAALISHGLALCRARGVQAVIVLGHPHYYPRFGFSADRAKSLRAPFSGDAFMALELAPGVLAGRSARVRYARAFGLD